MLKPWQIKCQASKVYYQRRQGVDSLIYIPAKEHVDFTFSILTSNYEYICIF